MFAKIHHRLPHWLQFGYSDRAEERVEFGRGHLFDQLDGLLGRGSGGARLMRSRFG